VRYLSKLTQFLVLVQQIAYKDYIQLSRMTTFEEGCLPFLRKRLYVERPSLLTIPPRRREMQAMLPTGCHLCCALSNPSSHHSQSHRRVVGFETTHKHTLQADYRQLED